MIYVECPKEGVIIDIAPYVTCVSLRRLTLWERIRTDFTRNYRDWCRK